MSRVAARLSNHMHGSILLKFVYREIGADRL